MIKKRCENCGKFPFCSFADKKPKDNCFSWIKRESNLKLINIENENFDFEKIE